MSLAAWATDIHTLLLPAGCLGCGGRIPPEEGRRWVCAQCRSRRRRAPWPRCRRCHLPLGTGRTGATECRECRSWPPVLTGARFAFLLESPVDRIVHALKYDGWAELALEMGREMAELALPEADPPDAPRIVVPVPTTKARRRARGYNQAALLARAFAAARALPLVEALRRVRGRRTQVALHPTQRRQNVAGAFRAVEALRARVEGMYVVLVDDVLTTGATALAAADVLERAGAAGVTLVTYARALPYRRR